jgi:hypothetical protein
VPIFTPLKLAATFSPVDPRKPKCPFFFFALRSGTALSKNSECSGLIQNKELAVCFIRVGAPNVKDQPHVCLARAVRQHGT